MLTTSLTASTFTLMSAATGHELLPPTPIDDQAMSLDLIGARNIKLLPDKKYRNFEGPIDGFSVSNDLYSMYGSLFEPMAFYGAAVWVGQQAILEPLQMWVNNSVLKISALGVLTILGGFIFVGIVNIVDAMRAERKLKKLEDAILDLFSASHDRFHKLLDETRAENPKMHLSDEDKRAIAHFVKAFQRVEKKAFSARRLIKFSFFAKEGLNLDAFDAFIRLRAQINFILRHVNMAQSLEHRSHR